MSNEEALNIIKEACASISANLATHRKIQEAIITMEAALQPKEEPPKKEK